MSIRILLADDQAMVRAGFRMILEADLILKLGVRPTMASLQSPPLTGLRPDLTLMDISNPRRSTASAAMMTEARGASNAEAKRELAWRPAHPSWRAGFAAA